jgi:hypothetical protein
MVNKRGLLRVVEATIAVLLIFGTLLILSARSATPTRDTFETKIPFVLDEIAHNQTLREEIIRGDSEEIEESKIEKLVSLRVANPSFNYSVEICDLEENCFLENYPLIDGTVIAQERVISASILNKSFAPKKIKLFMWQKG